MSGMLRMSAADYNAKMLKRKEGRVKNVRKKVVDGITFDSTKEARRYQDLVLMQQAGTVRALRRQVPYPIYIKGKKICDWFADFVYEERREHTGIEYIAWARAVEDVKGWKTDIYKLKKKMVEAEYGFKIRET